MIKNCFHSLIFLSVLFFTEDVIHAQPSEPHGFPFMQTYRRGDFVGARQTWGIVRADDGLIYFGNTRYGIQESDGLSWRNLRMDRNSAALSFAKHEDGRIFVGGQADFGFLEHDSLSRRSYTSLSYLLPDSLSTIKDVEYTFVLDGEVHFITPEIWFTYSDDQISVHKNDSRIISASKWRNSILTIHADGTLSQWTTNSERESLNVGSKNQIVKLSTSGERLFILDMERQLWEVKNSNDWNLLGGFSKYFEKNSALVNDFKWTESGYLLFSTTKGLFTFDQQGNYLYTIYADDGLCDDNVNKIFEDADLNIWVTSTFGVTVLEFGRPMREFLASAHDFPEYAAVLKNFNGKLYLGGNLGLYVWENGKFRQMYDGKSVFTLNTVSHGLLIGTSEGLDLLDQKGNFHPIFSQGRVDLVLPDRDNENVVYYSHDGVSLRKVILKSATNVEDSKLIDFKDGGYTFTEDINGDLWIGTGRNGDFQFISEQQNGIITSIKSVRQFTTDDGLPSNGFNYTMSVGKDVGFITSNGFYTLNQKRDSIVLDTRFEKIFEGQDKSVWPVTQDNNGGVWLAWAAALIGKAVYNPETQVFDWYDGEFTRTAPYWDIDHIYPTEKNRIYFQTYAQKLAYFDSSLVTKPLAPIRAHITYVTVKGDSTVTEPRGLSHSVLETPIQYEDNKIRFNYGMIAFLPEDRLFYEIKLEGLDDDWSGNTNERYHDYTNLREGKYTFWVRGFTLYPEEVEMASFTFEILPPWYRTWWAFGLYGLFGLGAIFALVKIREQSLLLRQKELEDEIQSRTQEIRQQKEQLEELDKVKSRFFSNVGHEFRTPLTIAKGLLDRTLKTEQLPDSAVEKMIPVMRNVDRLSTMVEQVMALSSIDNRVMAVRNELIAADQVVTLCVESFRSLVDLKEQTITYEPNGTGVFVDVDRNKMETVVNNLLSNAIKYNSKNGSIWVRTFQKESMYEIQVEDTGKGIDPSEEELIFERFHRIKQNEGNYVEGLGIGLELSRSYAEALGGEVLLDTTYSTGARFVFRIPISQISELDLPIQIEEEEKPKIISKPVLNVGSKTTRVLLVEDNIDMGTYLTEILRNEVHVVRVENGQEALNWLQRNTCDLIISDLMMPVMDGETFVRKLSENEAYKDIPVIVLTAKSNPEIRLGLFRVGIVDFINKPFNADELLFKIINLLGYVKTRETFRNVVEAETPKLMEQKVNEKISSYIIENISDSGLSADIIAQEFEMSRRTLYRAIQAETGLTFASFVKEVRLQHAYKISSTNSKLSLKDLAISVGYLDPNNFKKLFIERFGHPPNEA